MYYAFLYFLAAIWLLAVYTKFFSNKPFIRIIISFSFAILASILVWFHSNHHLLTTLVCLLFCSISISLHELSLRRKIRRAQAMPKLTQKQWLHHWKSLPDETFQMRAVASNAKFLLVASLILLTYPIAIGLLFFVFPYLRSVFPNTPTESFIFPAIAVVGFLIVFPLDFLYKHKKMGGDFVVYLSKPGLRIEKDHVLIFEESWHSVDQVSLGSSSRYIFSIKGKKRFSIALGGVLQDASSISQIQQLSASLYQRFKLSPEAGREWFFDRGVYTYLNPAKHRLP